MCHLKMKRAQEELHWLDIELKLLATWIVDEDRELEVALQTCRDTHPDMRALQAFIAKCRCLNDTIACAMRAVYKLDGFTGDTNIGHQACCDTDVDSSSLSDEAASDVVDQVYAGILSIDKVD